MKKRIYLASPYSSRSGNEEFDRRYREARFDAVSRASGYFLNHDVFIYSPIAHSHPIAIRCGLPTDFDFWEEYDRREIEGSDELWILKLPGWQDSDGVFRERAIAEDLGYDVKEIDPKEEWCVEIDALLNEVTTIGDV